MLIGTLAGVLPGIRRIGAMALLLPITLVLPVLRLLRGGRPEPTPDGVGGRGREPPDERGLPVR
jgi:hypothetical protein